MERIRQEEACPHKVMNHVKELAEQLFKNVSQPFFLLPCLSFYDLVFHASIKMFCFLVFSRQENPYPAVTMHKVTRPSEIGQNSAQNQRIFPMLDEVAVQLFIDHAAAKLKTAPPVVKAEVKGMVPSGPPLGELATSLELLGPEPSCGLISWKNVSKSTYIEDNHLIRIKWRKLQTKSILGSKPSSPSV